MVRRAESLPPAKLLYDARLSQGLLRSSGTLAVHLRPGEIQATLTGPFGSPVARYENGALRGDRIQPLEIEPEQLRWLLTGVWRAQGPAVVGLEGREALLRWEDSEQVVGVLDLDRLRFRSLRIARREGAILATYSGALEPWPERIEVEDVRSGNKLRLTLVAREAIP